MKNVWRIQAVLFCILLIAPVMAISAEDKEWKSSFEVSPYGGGIFPDKVSDDEDLERGALAGVRIGYNWSSVLGTEIEGNYGMSGFEDTDIDLDLLNARFSVLLNLDTDNLRWIPYLKAGGGNLRIDAGDETEEINPGMNAGLGLRYIFPELPLGIRAEGMSMWTGEVDAFEANAGLSWLFGKKKVWDADQDSVPDSLDQCPDTPAGVSVDTKGCTKDTDRDGVRDDNDKCPDTPAGSTVDETGCPGDIDGDGVFDGIDTCPNTPSGALVDASGCPKDGDNDGVVDGIDACPDTRPETSVDARGCEVAMEVEEVLILEDIYFDIDQSDISIEKSATLDELAEAMKNNPEIKILVTGHTDNTGSDSCNLALSTIRAEAVKTYLISKEIDSSRIKATGLGESSPIQTNDTADGRAKNRRVEVKRTE